MALDPVLAAVLGVAATSAITMLGYFLNRMIKSQDERNAEQAKTNKELQTCIQTLNLTLADILSDNKWSKQVCSERHQIINQRFKELGHEQVNP